ncbi:hypothetical protein V1477_017809 [Vespula maculifrons]|uniref:Uncharacterized protein n=1 Tax=Vespula maculifrons TaxID=7453 RepID=A0ABD2B161_VESMC
MVRHVRKNYRRIEQNERIPTNPGTTRAQRFLSNNIKSVLLSGVVWELTGLECSGREKYGRRGRYENFPMTTSPFICKNYYLLVLYKPLYLGYCWPDLNEKTMRVEGATRSFQLPRSLSSRCYSFGEKNC